MSANPSSRDGGVASSPAVDVARRRRPAAAAPSSRAFETRGRGRDARRGRDAARVVADIVLAVVIAEVDARARARGRRRASASVDECRPKRLERASDGS
tara:strand:+ start:3001 stop:3297 length:297 start_codon:yes stop_codon:yes gene_type:complete